MKLHVYVFTFKDEFMLPYQLIEYQWADRITVVDASPGSRVFEIVRAVGNVRYEAYDTRDSWDEYVITAMKNTVWKKSRGSADWVMVVDCDEFVYHPDLKAKLEELTARGYTAVRCLGYNMVSMTDDLPDPGRRLTEQIVMGSPHVSMNKMALFDPNRITEINFTHGMHDADPFGQVKVYDKGDIILAHMKFVDKEMFHQRRKESLPRFVRYLQARGVPIDKYLSRQAPQVDEVGHCLFWTRQQNDAEFDDMRRIATRVIE